MIKIVRVRSMIRKPLSHCRYPSCYNNAEVKIKDISVGEREFLYCKNHAKELIKKLEESGVESNLIIHLYKTVKIDEIVQTVYMS